MKGITRTLNITNEEVGCPGRPKISFSSFRPTNVGLPGFMLIPWIISSPKLLMASSTKSLSPLDAPAERIIISQSFASFNLENMSSLVSLAIPSKSVSQPIFLSFDEM